jgi:deazaflavin-dependent oxidoreductase (nitroreductase family)
MSIQLRLLHRALRLLSDYLMLPLFGLLGETRDSVLGGRLCVLHTIGRKSGRPREIPLNYAPTTQGLAIMAGFGRSTGWVHNLRAQPQAQVLVGSEMRAVVAVEVTDRDQAREVVRAVLKNAGAMGFFYGWDPRRASDEQVEKVTDELVCFHLRDASTPADALG